MSSNFTLPTLAFCDSIWNGEQFESHTSAEKFRVPLHVFRTEFMGYAQGLDAEFLCYEKRPFTFDEAIALAWLHGVEVRPYPGSLTKVTPIWRVMDRFGIVTAKWHPYWSDAVAQAKEESIKVSAWTKKRRALLFVSHLERRSEVVQLSIDAKKLGFKPARVTDALTGEALAIADGTLGLTFADMNYRILQVE